MHFIFVGIDIGGLFKDFLSDLSARVFDPSYGLFSITSDNLLYPNPSAILLYPEKGELETLYNFLGIIFVDLLIFHKCRIFLIQQKKKHFDTKILIQNLMNFRK